MRLLAISLVIALSLAGCGGPSGAIEGRLAEGVDATHVWAVGFADRAAVEDGAFRLEDIGGDLVDLRFAREDREIGRMEIRELPEGSTLTLERIWIDDGVAYPSEVELEGGGPVRINSLRYGTALGERIDTDASVLAVARDRDALLVRPAGDRLPDLRVVVTPGTSIHSPDGDPVPLRLSFGDSVRVRGIPESGYLVASEIVVPRAQVGGSRSGVDDSDSDSDRRGQASSSAADRPPQRRDEADSDARERARERARGRGKGKGKGRP